MQQQNIPRKKIPIPITVALITLLGVVITCITSIIINCNKENQQTDAIQNKNTIDRPGTITEIKKDTIDQPKVQIGQNNKNGANQIGFSNLNKTGK